MSPRPRLTTTDPGFRDHAMLDNIDILKLPPAELTEVDGRKVWERTSS